MVETKCWPSSATSRGRGEIIRILKEMGGEMHRHRAKVTSEGSILKEIRWESKYHCNDWLICWSQNLDNKLKRKILRLSTKVWEESQLQNRSLRRVRQKQVMKGIFRCTMGKEHKIKELMAHPGCIEKKQGPVMCSRLFTPHLVKMTQLWFKEANGKIKGLKADIEST